MSKLPDYVVGLSALGSAKTKATGYLNAALEAASPDLRQLFTQHMLDALGEHAQLSQLANQRGWYTPNVPPEAIVQQALSQAQPALGAQPTM